MSNSLLSSCQCTSTNSGPAGPLASALLRVLQEADSAGAAAMNSKPVDVGAGTAGTASESQCRGWSCTAPSPVATGCLFMFARLKYYSNFLALQKILMLKDWSSALTVAFKHNPGDA
jgi:hypothetical protein